MPLLYLDAAKIDDRLKAVLNILSSARAYLSYFLAREQKQPSPEPSDSQPLHESAHHHEFEYFQSDAE